MFRDNLSVPSPRVRIGVLVVLSNVNRFSVSYFITTMNSAVAEASTWKIKYLSEASVVCIFNVGY
jgi:hypothetical protein